MNRILTVVLGLLVSGIALGAAVKDHKTIGPGAPNQEQVYRVTYDFAKDGGATGALDLATASGDIVVTGIYAYVDTTATSGGSATLSVGKTGGATYFVGATAVASLTANALFPAVLVEGTPNTATVPVRIASGDKITQTIGTAALTAGKVHYVITVMRP